jgi:hypothetical protein
MTTLRPCAVCGTPSRSNAKYFFSGNEIRVICVPCHGAPNEDGWVFTPIGDVRHVRRRRGMGAL